MCGGSGGGKKVAAPTTVVTNDYNEYAAHQAQAQQASASPDAMSSYGSELGTSNATKTGGK